MKKLLFATLVLSLGLLIQSFTTSDASRSSIETTITYQGCTANDNLNITCKVFISRCRKGSINREFPSEFLDDKMSVVKKGSSAKHKKAWKLLNDNRFKK